MGKLYFKFILIAILISFINSQGNSTITTNATTTTTSSELCTLTGQQKQNPFPSLIKCYRYNSNSCCTSVHDDYIYNFISTLLTSSCVRRYRDLEDFVCYGCNPSEFSYTNRDTKVLSLCASFALRLWNGTVMSDLNAPTTIWDNCGFKVSPGASPNGLVSLANGKAYVIPSESFATFSEFFTNVGMPFYDGYTMQIIDDITDPNNNVCFASSNYLRIEIKFFYILVLALLF